MTPFEIPRWYGLLGRFLTPLFAAVRSPRIGPWPESQLRPTWIHAASLGELKGVLRLVEALGDDHPVFLTSTTKAGLGLLKKQAWSHPCALLPLDSPTVATAFLDEVRPSSAVFFESETWPTVLSLLQEREIPVAFAAFRTGRESMRRWSRFSKAFPGWTESVTTVWTDGISGLEPLREMGFRDPRSGSGLKWAGWAAIDSTPLPTRSAAMSIHLRDFGEMFRMLRNGRERAWMLFPRRLWLRLPLRILVAVSGLRFSTEPTPAPGCVWISPRFGLAGQALKTCAWVWVSEGHDTEEPFMYGAHEVWTGSPRRRVPRPATAPDRTRTEIVEWIAGHQGKRET